jgi:hypothetical protein
LLLSRALTTCMRGPANVDAVTVADGIRAGKSESRRTRTIHFAKFGDDLTRSPASKAERDRKQRADAVIGSVTTVMHATKKGQ